MTSTSQRLFGEPFADFDDLQRQFERLFGLRGSGPIRSVARGAFPQVNVGSTPEAVEVFAFAPGLDVASLDVTVDKGLLSISGERKPATPEGLPAGTPAVTEGSARPAPSRVAVYARERPSGSFRRVIALPEDADPNRVDASYRCGVLRVRIEKREASRPRRISVS